MKSPSPEHQDSEEHLVFPDPMSPNGTSPRIGTVVLGLLAGAVCLLPLDIPVAIWCKDERIPGFFRDVINQAEVFGHGAGILWILAAVVFLDANGLRSLPRLAACAWGAGLTANLIKTLLGRIRPRDLELVAITDVWQTFGSFGAILHSSSGHSFPSAHTATAFGLFCGLVQLYPQGRRLFLTIAITVGIQRVLCSAHFPSDVCVGAAVGLVVGHLTNRWFDQSEQPQAHSPNRGSTPLKIPELKAQPEEPVVVSLHKVR